MAEADPTLTERFERGEIEPAAFGHEDHLRVAVAMLRRYDFWDASLRYARTIRNMAEGAGAPQKYNATVTLAFMSLVAERLAGSHVADGEAFLAANPDLLDKSALERWYTRDRLHSPLARAQFLMPDRMVG